MSVLVEPGAVLEKLGSGAVWAEGPVWLPGSRTLRFSDIPNKRIVRWRRLPEGPELTTFATGMSNGLTLDRQGRVLAAEHDGRPHWGKMHDLDADRLRKLYPGFDDFVALRRPDRAAAWWC